MLELRPSNPNRPPAWRWMRARVAEDRRLPRSRTADDKHIARARKFIRYLQRWEDQEDRMLTLACCDPDIYEAWALYDSTGSGQVMESRWELEARLLAGEEMEVIERKLSLPANCAHWYEALFFNVNDRLESPGYITHTIIGNAIHTGLAGRQYDCLWKMFGYWGGPHVLDVALYRGHNRSRSCAAEAVTAYFGDDLREQLSLKAAISVRSMEINWQTQLEIVNLYLRMMEAEKSGGSGGAAQTFLLNVQAAADSMPWTKDPPLQQRLEGDEGATTLRATELMFLGAGHSLYGLEQIAATTKFPAPNKAREGLAAMNAGKPDET